GRSINNVAVQLHLVQFELHEDARCVHVIPAGCTGSLTRRRDGRSLRSPLAVQSGRMKLHAYRLVAWLDDWLAIDHAREYQLELLRAASRRNQPQCSHLLPLGSMEKRLLRRDPLRIVGLPPGCKIAIVFLHIGSKDDVN